jgi:DNA polymerase III delta prime subunit
MSKQIVYTPTKLDEIVGLNDIKHFLQQIIDGKNEVQNLYFYGSPGTGKTSTILSFLNEMKETIDYYVYNLSYKNGVDFVRKDIINICKKKIKKKYKFIVLDEIDSLSKEGQTYISYCIREYPKVKFCFISNTIHDIIHYIIDNSKLFYFDSHTKENFYDLIHKISKKNNITLTKNEVENICCLSNYDMRKVCKILNSSFKENKIILDTELITYNVKTISHMLYEYLNKGIDYYTIYKYYRELVVEKLSWRQTIFVDEIDHTFHTNINYSYVLPSLLKSILMLKNLSTRFLQEKQKKMSINGK